MCLLSAPAFAANRFWVGDSGNWNDTAHWSDTSGGASGFSVPSTSDNCIGDANSFTIPGQTLTVNVNANCLDFSFSGVANSPTLDFGGNNLHVAGSLSFAGTYTLSPPPLTTFLEAAVGGQTITTGGKPMFSFQFTGTTGAWTLLSNWTQASGSQFLVQAGTVNLNGFTVVAQVFQCATLGAPVCNFGSSLIETEDFETDDGGGVVNAGTSTVRLTLVNGGGATKSDGGSAVVLNTIECDPSGGPCEFANTTNAATLLVHPGSHVFIDSSPASTINVTSLSGDGTSGNHVILDSDSGGSQADLIVASDQSVQYWDIKDNICSCSGLCSVLPCSTFGGANNGNTIGWNFLAAFTPTETPADTPTDTPTAGPTDTPTETPTPDANSCCQCELFGNPVCVAPPPTTTPGVFTCGGSCGVVPDAHCDGTTGLCTNATPTETPTATAIPTAWCCERDDPFQLCIGNGISCPFTVVPNAVCVGPEHCATVTPTGNTRTPTMTRTPKLRCATYTPTPIIGCPYRFTDNTGDLGKTCLFTGSYNGDGACSQRTLPLAVTFGGDGHAVSLSLATEPGTNWTGHAMTATTASVDLLKVSTFRAVPASATATMNADATTLTIQPGANPPISLCAFSRGCTPDEACPFSRYVGTFTQVIDATHPPPTRAALPRVHLEPTP